MKSGSPGGTRTPDPVINSHLLYQLSYSGKCSNCNDLLPQTQPRTRSKFSTNAPDSSAPVINALGNLSWAAHAGQATPEASGAQKEHLEGPGPDN